MPNQEKRYYVYHIINPITNRLFYVGKGTGNRCKQHLTDKREYSFNKRLNGYIRNLIEEGHKPITIKIAEDLTEEAAYELEEQEIKSHGRVGFEEGGVLLNILESGRPPKLEGENHPWFGRKHTQETKDKISKTKKERFASGQTKKRTGFKHSDETKEKNRQSHLGKKRTPEAIEKTRQANLGRPQTDFQKEKAREANQKKWLIIRPDGTEKIIVNLNAYCKEKDLSSSNMSSVAAGRLRQHKGYKVQRLDD